MIRIEQVTKVFETKGGQVRALKNVSLHVPPGEICGIIGMSGAGKSTLLRCMALLEQPTEGTVAIDGVRCDRLNKHQRLQLQRRIGIVFQGYNLLAQRTIARLRLDNATQERVAALISRHHLPVEPTRRWAGRWLSRLGEECFFQLLALKGADASACAPPLKAEELAPLERAEALGRQLLEEEACLSLRALAVNGHDALEVGLTGPQIGRALQGLLDQVAQGELPNERSALLSALKGYLPS